MPEIRKEIVITGIVCLTTIYIALLIAGQDLTIFGHVIIGTIALSIGVVMPTPKLNNKRGTIKW